MMSKDQIHFDDEESRFRALWGPIAMELRPDSELPKGLKTAVFVRRTNPSRDFLVRQAVLNALDEHYHSHIAHVGTAAAMRRLITQCGWEHGQPSGWFVRSVRSHFAVLAAQYQ